MINKNFDWRSSLADLFGGSVNQGTLEEAAELMVSVSAGDDDYHNECLLMLDQGLCAAKAGDGSVIYCINGSSYRVSTTLEAEKLLKDFLEIYLKEYERAGSA